MADTIPSFNATGDIERKYIACAIDVSATSTPEYLVVGYKMTSSYIETNPDVETGTDIRGMNFSSINKFEPSQTFEPHRLTKGEDGKLGEKLLHLFRYRKLAEFSMFKVMMIWGMLGQPGAYAADHYDACTLSPDSIGGESWAEMPFTVNFGGNITHGKADKLIGLVAFTPDETPEV